MDTVTLRCPTCNSNILVPRTEKTQGSKGDASIARSMCVKCVGVEVARNEAFRALLLGTITARKFQVLRYDHAKDALVLRLDPDSLQTTTFGLITMGYTEVHVAPFVAGLRRLGLVHADTQFAQKFTNQLSVEAKIALASLILQLLTTAWGFAEPGKQVTNVNVTNIDNSTNIMIVAPQDPAPALPVDDPPVCSPALGDGRNQKK